MTQKDKDLLLKDLSARLHYGVKVKTPYNSNAIVIGIVKRKGFIKESELIDILTNKDNYPIGHIKPYLFPLSSMNEEQLKSIENAHHIDVKFIIDIMKQEVKYGTDIIITHETVDWCNKNHFDYRGLIDKGLAIDCTNLNIY